MATKPLVLVVDGEHSVRRRLWEELEDNGYAVVVAARAERGLVMARRDHPCLVILGDIFGVGQMRGYIAVLGLEALLQFKELGIPVIYFSLSVGQDPSVRRLAKALGAAVVIDKAPPLTELIETVRRLVSDAVE